MYQVLRYVARHAQEPMKSEANYNLSFLEDILASMQQIDPATNDSYIVRAPSPNLLGYRRQQPTTRARVRLGVGQHDRITDTMASRTTMAEVWEMLNQPPPTAAKLLQESGITRAQIEAEPRLVADLLYFLTPKKEWSRHIIQKYRIRRYLIPGAERTDLFLKQVRTRCFNAMLRESDTSCRSSHGVRVQDPRKLFRTKYKLGGGSFSEVVLARCRKGYTPTQRRRKHDVTDTSTVALKIFHRSLSDDENDIRNEVRSHQRVSHYLSLSLSLSL